MYLFNKNLNLKYQINMISNFFKESLKTMINSCIKIIKNNYFEFKF